MYRQGDLIMPGSPMNDICSGILEDLWSEMFRNRNGRHAYSNGSPRLRAFRWTFFWDHNRYPMMAFGPRFIRLTALHSWPNGSKEPGLITAFGCLPAEQRVSPNINTKAIFPSSSFRISFYAATFLTSETTY